MQGILTQKQLDSLKIHGIVPANSKIFPFAIKHARALCEKNPFFVEDVTGASEKISIHATNAMHCKAEVPQGLVNAHSVFHSLYPYIYESILQAGSEAKPSSAKSLGTFRNIFLAAFSQDVACLPIIDPAILTLHVKNRSKGTNFSELIEAYHRATGESKNNAAFLAQFAREMMRLNHDFFCVKYAQAPDTEPAVFMLDLSLAAVKIVLDSIVENTLPSKEHGIKKAVAAALMESVHQAAE